MQQTHFAHLAPTPAAHFRLYFYGAVLRVINLAVDALGGVDPVMQKFPFLRGYMNELAEHGLEGKSLHDGPAWWRDSLSGWEQAAAVPLPLSALRAALGLGHDAVLLLIAAGLAEEDGRFAEVFQTLHGAAAQPRPTATLLGALSGLVDRADARPMIRQFVSDGLLQPQNPDDPYPAWALAVPNALWDVMRGDAPAAPAAWLRHRPASQQIPLAQLVLPAVVRAGVERLPTLMAAGEVGGVLVRGPRHNGRRTLVAALAAAAGYGTLEIRGLDKPEDERWRLVGPLATLLGAVPVVVADLAPGETLRVPALHGYRGPRGFVLGNQGGIDAVDAERLITVGLTAPPAEARRRHWASTVVVEADALDRIAPQFRMSSGSIRRAATLAHAYAALAARTSITVDDAREAARALSREALDALAVREPARGDWSQVVCSHETRQELATLEARCRQREKLAAMVGPALAGSLNAGVRALLKGPSGTGKTLAARVLAASLGMDLYRVDLSAVVNKYIGETEKNLHRIFARAEELDVMLLFDEGDALLGRRTSVNNANDRYANLETNFLLQRLESYEGVVLVTTNAPDHIDGAFQRRMDVMVDFRAPDAAERFAIWRLHLPDGHQLPESLMREVAQRCVLTGGQIRNAVLHAALLATDDGGSIAGAHLEAAIQREYRKLGGVCPLRRASRPALSGV
jgi:hypothetical protein